MSSEPTKKNITSIKDVKKREYKTPKCTWDPSIEKEIQTYIRKSLSQSDINIFENISGHFQTFYDRSCTNMTQLKKRTKNESGFIWEHFCLMYLKSKGYGECWLIADTPEEILKKLNLSRIDMGIDIVIKHKNGFFAVQAKWRSNKKKASKISLTWNKLSTFYALCARSGPWLKYIVITNCDYVRRQGRKSKMDQTIAKGSFFGCKRESWIKMAGMEEGKNVGNKLTDTSTKDKLLNDVCNLTGRNKHFYSDWNEDNLKQRIEGFIEYVNETKPETLIEKQRRQREDFIKKIIEQTKYKKEE